MKKDKERDNHQGSVAAEDADLSLWLNRLWARNEPPERIELWQTFGRNKLDRGELIHHEDFKPNEKLDIEQANKLANELMAAAQNDCDSSRREAWYQLAVIDRNRRSSPLVRRIGPLQPKRTYAIARPGGSAPDDADDEQLDAKNLGLAHIKIGFDEVRWDKQRNDRVLGEALLLLHNTVQNQQVVIDRLFSQSIAQLEKFQEAQDRSLDRELARDKAKFTLNMWSEGLRSARNLLPGFFGPSEGGEKRAPLADDGETKTNGKTYGQSPERVLVDNFLNDCEAAKIDIALFGDFEEHDGKLVQKSPGIFSLKQFRVFVGVRDGRLPVHALDELIPNSGHEISITEDQINKSLAAGVTAGIGMALRELFIMRQSAMQAATNGAQKHSAPHEETL